MSNLINAVETEINKEKRGEASYTCKEPPLSGAQMEVQAFGCTVHKLSPFAGSQSARAPKRFKAQSMWQAHLGRQRWGISCSAGWTVSPFFIIVSEHWWCASWELDAARSVRHATKEKKKRSRPELFSLWKQSISHFSETHRDTKKPVRVSRSLCLACSFSKAWIKEGSVAIAMRACLMGVTPLFLRRSL